MSTESGASEHPLMLYGGQPISREMAATKRAELLAQPEYARAFDNNDQARLVELKDYWMLERGMVPSPPPAEPSAPKNPGDVLSQMDERVVRDIERHAQVIDKNFDLTPQQQFEVLAQRPVQAHEKAKAGIELQKLQRDAAFMQKWRDGDRVARTTMYLWNCVRAAPLGTLEQVLEWDERHPFVEKDRA